MLNLQNESIHLPDYIKDFFWKFIRYDISIRQFEHYLYNASELSSIFTAQSHEDILILDYNDCNEVLWLKKAIFNLLAKQPLDCLCATLNNNTMFPITNEFAYKVLDTYSQNLVAKKIIKEFSGQPPIHYSRWYNQGSLNVCNKCQSYWFMTWDESDCDYYLVRLTKDEFFKILHSPDGWPNDNWKDCLKNWHGFLNLDFMIWNDLYHTNNYQLIKTNNHIMDNFILNIDAYTIHKELMAQKQ